MVVGSSIYGTRQNSLSIRLWGFSSLLLLPPSDARNNFLQIASYFSILFSSLFATFGGAMEQLNKK